jgi:hypothetical protein
VTNNAIPFKVLKLNGSNPWIGMISITDDELLRYNELGLIPGPEEHADDFEKRARYCLGLRVSFDSKLSDNAPFTQENRASDALLQEAFHITQPLYGIKPDWIPVFFSNYKLAPWHGGCAWIFQETEKTPTGAFFQLRSAFKSSTTYLGLYKRQELIAHELSHVGRMMYEEPRFEEVLAYRSDSSGLRRYLGPIMQSSFESAMFVLLLFIIIIIDFFLSASLNPATYENVRWLKLVPLGMILYALGRLYRKQSQFSKCLKQLQEVFKGNQDQAQAVIYRLTDDEIIDFAKKKPQEIEDFSKHAKENSLRWHVISKAYFEK